MSDIQTAGYKRILLDLHLNGSQKDSHLPVCHQVPEQSEQHILQSHSNLYRGFPTMQDIDYSATTALVTGGSSGIGRAIAKELVKRGVRRLVLVAQNEGRLAETVSEIEGSTPGTT